MSLVRFDPCLVAVKQLFIVSQINIVSRPVVLLQLVLLDSDLSIPVSHLYGAGNC